MFVQVSWLLTTPKVAHGLVSKDADNVYITGGTVANQVSWLCHTPNRFAVPANNYYDANSFFGSKAT